MIDLSEKYFTGELTIDSLGMANKTKPVFGFLNKNGDHIMEINIVDKKIYANKEDITNNDQKIADCIRLFMIENNNYFTTFLK